MSNQSITRILFVHHRPELGGAPTSLSLVIANLDRQRYEAHVFCPPGPAAALFRDSGATVHYGTVASFTHIWASTYSGRRWLILARELCRLPAHVAGLARLLSQHDFDLVHLNDSPMIVAAWLARRAGKPVVWHLRSAPAQGGLRTRLVRSALKRYGSVFIAINEDIARLWRLPAQVIPNAVALDRFHPGDSAGARAAAGLPADGSIVSYFGFVYPSKGFREFIQAAALLRARGSDATFVLVGGGVRSPAFFRTPFGRTVQFLGLARDHATEAGALVRELGLTEAFRFIPFTRDTAELYRASDVVVSPSQGPEIGRPVLEAAASGVAVVLTGTTSGGGIVQPDATAVVADDAGADALAQAVAALLADPERRAAIGAAARRHAEQTFDPVASTRRIESVYEAVRGRVDASRAPAAA